MWTDPPQNVMLKEKEVQVWKADLQTSLTQRAEFWNLLSEEEKERADRFKFREHRNYFIAARGVLRTLLSKYLSLDPKDLAFSYGEQGKPGLRQFPQLQFNVSHSKNFAIFAFAKNEPIGVDLEYIDPSIDFAVIAPRFFTKNEATTLLDLPTNRRPAVFFNCWTRKEAFIKAKGGGLSIPLNQFEMTLLENEPAKLLSIDWEPEAVKLWSVFSFIPEKDMVGALAIKAPIEVVSYFDFNKF